MNPYTVVPPRISQGLKDWQSLLPEPLSGDQPLRTARLMLAAAVLSDMPEALLDVRADFLRETALIRRVEWQQRLQFLSLLPRERPCERVLLALFMLTELTAAAAQRETHPRARAAMDFLLPEACDMLYRTANLLSLEYGVSADEKLGGMAKAIETGLPKMRIEEAAARRQARIDSGRENIVGLNYMQLEHEDAIDILEVDNTAVREAQIARLNKLRANRDNAKVQQCLDAITKSVETGEGNLLELAVEAARARASLGEISMAVEKVCGRHKAVIRSISGVYSKESSDTAAIERVRKMTDEFEKREGRRPRIMVAKMGQDGHDRGAKVVATAYADMGFDVDVGPLFQTPAETARDAVDNDVHIVGMSSLAAGHKTLLPQLMEELKKLGREDIMVIAGGVIPPQDYDFLYKAGAACIFGPGTRIPEAAEEMLNKLNDRLGYTK